MDKKIKLWKFSPILKQTLWGGDKIASLKRIPDSPGRVGESWELSGVEGNISVVAEGPCAGMSLTELIDREKESLMGTAAYQRFGHNFPLLVKFIDAQQDLSIQVHPTDEQARSMGKPCGKTEMWVLMDGSSGDAFIRVGFNEKITPETYKHKVADGTICDVIERHAVVAGDCYFLPASCIHSIGAGCLLLEIQQTSDVTYRIFDFNRRDANGNFRQLHTEEAARCINFSTDQNYHRPYQLRKNELTQIVDCRYFTTHALDVDGEYHADLSKLDSFIIVVSVKGSGTVQADDSEPMSLKAGETLLVAAATQQLTLTGDMKIVTTSIHSL